MDQYDEQTLKEAIAILEGTPLIDGHNDWPAVIRELYQNRIENASFAPDAELRGHIDLTRLRKGRMGGIFLSAYMRGALPAGDFSDAAHHERVHDTLQQIDLIHRLVAKYGDSMALVDRADQVLPTFSSGKIPCFIGIEGLHQVGNCPSILRMYHRLGARYVTLTHNENNLFADSATAEPVHNGLSAVGRQMVQEMNRIGMIIDLSHVSEQVMRQALDLSAAPVLFTHSNARALCNVPRNVPDSVLDKVKGNGGVVMVTFVPKFVSSDLEGATHGHVVDHMEYIAKRIGWAHIGVGTDYDGTARIVKGLEDVSCLPALVAEMLKRGIERKDIEGVLGHNVLRVLKGVEEVAAKKQKDGEKAMEEEKVESREDQWIGTVM